MDRYVNVARPKSGARFRCGRDPYAMLPLIATLERSRLAVGQVHSPVVDSSRILGLVPLCLRGQMHWLEENASGAIHDSVYWAEGRNGELPFVGP
jgi:hypothetical protein